MARHTLIAMSLLLGACSEYRIDAPDAESAPPGGGDLAPVIQRDRLVQVPPEAVDVLWVVDNSCSMADEQAYVAHYFPRFMDFFVDSGIDYHIGVVSTDMDDPGQSGRLRERGGHPFIDVANPDPIDIFADMAQVGTRGSGEEKGISATYAALEMNRDGANRGFRRDDANLHVVVVSDEEDHGVDGDAMSQEGLVAYLLGVEEEQGSDVTFSSIVNPLFCDCPPWGFEAPGVRYIQTTGDVGGMVWDIHRKAWDILLSKLGIQAAGLGSEFFLTRVPVVPTLEVTVVEDEEELVFAEGVDWAYDRQRNSVVFHDFVPAARSEVFFEYEVAASATP